MSRIGHHSIHWALVALIGTASAAAAVDDHNPTQSDHWSFQPIVRPAVPQIQPSDWVLNPIDAFVARRLETVGIDPSPVADRATLARRLSLDLTGLPPSISMVRAFIEDTRPTAYDRLVDQLLHSPHYGEQWGRHWLDLARYADSDGYEKDTVRPWAWRYRDWVIRAINDDMPFDRFTREQLAGDLLENATLEQRIATGLHRNTLTNKEGGVDQEEFRCKAVVDRVNTTGTIWLGLTVGCAECHDHKYDPISQKEYYRLFAFFNNADEKDIAAPRPEEQQAYESQLAQWQKRRSQLVERRDEYEKHALPREFDAWLQTAKVPSEPWNVLHGNDFNSLHGTKLSLREDGFVAAEGKSPDMDTYSFVTAIGPGRWTGLRLEVATTSGKEKSVGRSASGNFVLSELAVRLHSETASTIPLVHAQADFAQDKYPVQNSVDGDAATGWAVVPNVQENHIALYEFAEPLTMTEPGELQWSLTQNHGSAHTLRVFRVSLTSEPTPLTFDPMPDRIATILRASPEDRTDSDMAALREYHATRDPGWRAVVEPLTKHDAQKPRAPATKAQTMVQTGKRRETHIHERGDFLRPGEAVQFGTPSVLPKHVSPPDTPERLVLADWLMDPANPLTARVTVNRMWQHLFGRGLVATPEDFGTRGELPSHPELLDWLASEWVRLGWSRRELIRLIVTSNTYRQSSHYRPELEARDPLNTWLARQNRFRLSAENVRDGALTVCGLICRMIGGPSVRPPLPADIAALGYANSVQWNESQGADKHRRGMYILFQRTVPYPMLTTFDSPDSNTTCARRERSNTPLQALTLLNDPVFHDCAVQLAERVRHESSDTHVDRQIDRIFQHCLARSPSSEERGRLHDLYDQHVSLASSSGENGDTTPDPATAALVAVSRVVLNLDEFITRE